MADEIPIEKLLDLANSKDIGSNANSLFGMLKEANKTIKELQSTTNMLKQMGLLPLLVRGFGKKLDVDVDTPISDNSIEPASDMHKTIITGVNKLTETELTEFSKVLVKYETDKQAAKDKQPPNK